MKRISLIIVFILSLSLCAYADDVINLDLTGATMVPTAPESFTLHNIAGFLNGMSAGNYWADIIWDPTNFVFVPVAYGPETTDPAFERAQWLLGKWYFSFTIINSFAEKYTLSSLDTSETNSEGGYFVYGTDDYDNMVIASYYPLSAQWILLDPGSIIDEVYLFFTDGTIILPNSYYYQADPNTEEIISSGYDLYGYKYSQSTAVAKHAIRREIRIQSQVARSEEATPGTAPHGINKLYQQLRARVQ